MKSMHRRQFIRLATATAVGAATPAAWARARPLRVGIVGGGIVGASIACHLAQAGARVTVFEKTGPAMGATRNSFAWLNAFVADMHYRDLRLRSLLAYHDLDRRLGLNIVWGGYLNWAADAALAGVVRENAAQLATSPFPAIAIGASEMAALSPNLAPGPVAAGIYSAIDGHLDPVHVTNRFLDVARAHGASVRIPCELREIKFHYGRLIGAVTSQGSVKLDRLVIAAGVDTPRLLALCGFALRLRHAPGILAHSVPLGPLTRIIHDGPGNLTFKQMADGRIVGTDASEPPDLPVHAEIRARPVDFPDEALRALHGNRILGKIGTVLPAAREAKLEWLSLGFRPMPLDDLPVVGAVPGVRDVHVAVTHSGVTLAPILGRYVTRELLDAGRVEELAPYRPERFGGPAASSVKR
jgi:glycine/D-amino acid oxidase-like deaminating enzyme